MRPKIILWLSIPLTILITIVSYTGFFTPGFYAAETLNWQTQSTGQDIIDLLLVAPCLLASSLLAARGDHMAGLIWGGIVLYCTYTFTLYCFDVHFNRLFILYCICFGLSFYSVLYFLFHHSDPVMKAVVPGSRIAKVTAVYFILTAVLFYLLWLKEIMPAALNNRIPKSLADIGLPTNGVHALDLSIFLPAVFTTGIFLLKRKFPAYLFAPALLTFFVLMDITILVLAAIMYERGITSDNSVSAIMAFLALFSLALLTLYLRNIRRLLNVLLPQTK